MSRQTLESPAAPMGPRFMGLWVVLALLMLGAARLTALNWTSVGLHVDEAQYWLWSRNLDWGYYSKPPGIAALIAASTALLGDGTNGIRALSMLCWLACSALLVNLGTRLHSPRAGWWAGLLFSVTPAANLLGLVATTDALLMLGWIAVMACASRLCPPVASDKAGLNGMQNPPTWAAWLLLGFVWGLTLASKYTAAALAPSLLWLLWDASRSVAADRRPALWRGALLASVVAGACLLPNLIWNAWQGWPTLQHTLDITVRAGQAHAAGSSADAVLRVLHFVAGLFVVSGPGLWAVGVLAAASLRRAAQQEPVSPAARGAMYWSARFVWPLALVGFAQALSGGVQINWTAPVLGGLCLLAGIWLADRPQSRRATTWVLLAASVSIALSLWVAASQDLRWQRSRSASGVALDFWHKTRHWSPALAPMLPHLAREPLPVWTGERDVLVQTAYAGRDQSLQLRSWSADGRIRNHFDQFFPAQPGPDRVWWLDRQPPPAALQNQWGHVTRVEVSTHGPLHLELWRLERPSGSMQ